MELSLSGCRAILQKGIKGERGGEMVGVNERQLQGFTEGALFLWRARCTSGELTPSREEDEGSATGLSGPGTGERRAPTATWWNLSGAISPP